MKNLIPLSLITALFIFAEVAQAEPIFRTLTHQPTQPGGVVVEVENLAFFARYVETSDRVEFCGFFRDQATSQKKTFSHTFRVRHQGDDLYLFPYGPIAGERIGSLSLNHLVTGFPREWIHAEFYSSLEKKHKISVEIANDRAPAGQVRNGYTFEYVLTEYTFQAGEVVPTNFKYGSDFRERTEFKTFESASAELQAACSP